MSEDCDPWRVPNDERDYHGIKIAPYEVCKLKKKYGSIVLYHTKGLKKIEGRNHYRCTWYRTNRRHDPDNVSAGGTKILLDGLTASRVLENDGHKQIGGFTHLFGVDKQKPRVEVEITPMEDE